MSDVEPRTKLILEKLNILTSKVVFSVGCDKGVILNEVFNAHTYYARVTSHDIIMPFVCKWGQWRDAFLKGAHEVNKERVKSISI